MAVDSGWIVAGSSLATIIATGFFTLRAKRIEAEQKLNEHKLATRSTYAAKKIEAGQVFVSKVNIVIHKIGFEVSMLNYLKHKVKMSQEAIDKITNARQAILNNSLNNNDFTDLYFDMDEINQNHKALVVQFNEVNREYNRIVKTPGREGLVEIIDSMIALYDKMTDSYQSMNAYVRNDLAKYDMI